MLPFPVCNRQAPTLNSQVSCVITQRTHNFSTIAWSKRLWEQLYSQVNTYFSKTKERFIIRSTSRSERVIHKQIIDLCSVSTGNISSRLQYPFALQTFTNNLLSNNSLQIFPYANTQASIKLAASSQKCQHLFNQIRSFKTNREIKNDGRFFSKMKGIFIKDGGKSGKLHIMNDIESFYQTLCKENMSKEQSQKLLLAFTEGYLLAKERPKSNWKLYVTGVFLGLVGLILFLKTTNIASIFQTSSISLEISDSNVKFSDVKGADEAKRELKTVVEFLKNPDKFSALGGKLPKGVLLVGPPGTGKTLLAKAVAGEAGVPFFSTSGPEFDEIYVGVGARRIRELFKVAKENIPCVIFIDEIDSIGKERTSSSLHPHANDTINQLLSEMDGFRNSGGIIVLGATNRKADLDKALLRPGRFDVEVTVSVPDYTGRKELLGFYLDKIRHQNVDIEKLARGTTNFTGADIENMVNQAALRAAVIGAQYVSMEHLEHARDKALMGPESMSRITDEETNRITAYHEGGHTVVAYFTEHSQPLHKVTIIARGSSLGHTAYIPDKDIYHVTKTQLLAMLDAMMGGRAAEELVFGPDKITSGASSDLEKATDLASKMVKRWGMSDVVGLSTYNGHNLISPHTANVIDSEVKKVLQESYERAKNILTIHKEKHKQLSEALLKYETLDAAEIDAIMRGSADFTRPQQS